MKPGPEIIGVELYLRNLSGPPASEKLIQPAVPLSLLSLALGVPGSNLVESPLGRLDLTRQLGVPRSELKKLAFKLAKLEVPSLSLTGQLGAGVSKLKKVAFQLHDPKILQLRLLSRAPQLSVAPLECDDERTAGLVPEFFGDFLEESTVKYRLELVYNL